MSKIYSNKGLDFKSKLSKFLKSLTGLLRPFDPFGGRHPLWYLSSFIAHRVKVCFFQIIFFIAIIRMPLCQDQIFLDANKMLRMHRFETETFQVNRIYGDFSGSIRAAEKYYCEKTFDNTHRLSKEIFWIKNDNVELDSISSYFYDTENSIPSRKEQIIFSENKFVETIFNENNQPQQVAVYNLNETKNQRDTRISVATYNYDSQGRIVEENFTDEDNWTERRTYKYTNKASQPDRQIFENNFLVLDVVHKNNSDRTETIYFEDNFSVEKIYKNNTKKTEIFRRDGKVVRTRDLENDDRFAQLDAKAQSKHASTDAVPKEGNDTEQPATEALFIPRTAEERRTAKDEEQAAKEAAAEAEKAAKKATAEAEKLAKKTTKILAKVDAELAKIAKTAASMTDTTAAETFIAENEPVLLAKKAEAEALLAVKEEEAAAKRAEAEALKAEAKEKTMALEAAAEALKAEKSAEKEAKKAEAEALKAAKEAEKEAKKAEAKALKAAKEAEKEAKKAEAEALKSEIQSQSEVTE